jgi:deoxycytidine triphosphate deaminase
MNLHSRKVRLFEGCPFRRMASPFVWTAHARLVIVALMQLLSGKDAADHIAGIIHPKYQVHGFSVHLTVRKIWAIDPAGKLDFGGGEYVPAGRVEIAPLQLRPGDNYLWWELDRESYFVECNETISLASDQIALIEPEDRLLRAGAWHVPLFVRGHVDPVELLLTVGILQLRVKENARIARVRLFRVDQELKSARTRRKSGAPKSSRSKRK